ncbi:luciferase family oxidoreductase group 1 [Rhodococcus sp. 27YEA15]|uniref:LLM class flavin-dependent oxidoreductase n=1 Tax=Rhodococcus sp. 27YEA15 TaxID=3156259 RepID=UPI003C7E3C5A
MTVLSFLDQGPVSAATGPTQTLFETVRLAQLAEELGYVRFWVAEHHGVRNMAISAPEIMIGHIADRTSTIRVGAGGIMLPNHTPLHVAEQFRTLEALHPGRIDLGIGRSTGTGDEQTRAALLRHPDGIERFADHLAQLLAIGGKRDIDPTDPYRSLIASPGDAPLPDVFVLGSSVNSARYAGGAGLGYAFFCVNQRGDRAIDALRSYRENFVPAFPGARPRAILAIRVWVGDDQEHAEALAASERLAVLDFLAGDPRVLEPMDAALQRNLTSEQLVISETLDTTSDVVGDVETVRRRFADLLDSTGADEIIAISNIHDPAQRRGCLRRLAEAATDLVASAASA